MRPAFIRTYISFFIFLTGISPSFSQNPFNTGLNGTVIDLPCNQTCVNIPVRIPHLKSTDNYAVVSVPYNPFPYVTTAPALSTGCTNQDDKFFDTTFLPFQFCFYGGQYTRCVISTNGLVTFDTTNALKGSNWALGAGNQLPFAGTGTQGTGTCPTPTGTLFPRASIMGAYYDIYLDAASFPNKKMQVEVYGTAPFRNYVVSFFEIPLFGCTSVQATQQIVLYESTGLIDVYIGNKPPCGSNSGLAILGIQNWNRDQAVTAPGKNCTNWSESNTGYRFVPSGVTSRFVSCVVETLTGTLIATGDTATVLNGTLDVTFPAFCPTATSGQYVVKTTYAACDNPDNLIINLDTITVNRTTALNATATTTQTGCGITGTGTATITVPAGVGTPPYTFAMTPGTTATGASPYTFNNLNAGTYSVLVTDAAGVCNTTIPITITSTGVLAVSYTVTNTSCPGANNGQIVVNPPNALPPITYSINGGPFTANNTFSNLAPGVYFISTHAGGGCVNDFAQVQVLQGTSNVTGTAAPTNTSCAGVNNGQITVTVTSTGAGPFQFSINNGASWQSGNVFTGLNPGSYQVLIREAGLCLSNAIPVIIAAGTGLQAGITSTSTTCTGATNGSITVSMNAGSGTAPFTFVLDGAITQTSATNSTTFNNVASGSHSVTITDANGCSTSAPLTINVTTGSGFNATFVPTPTGCAGASNGSLAITAQAPGLAPFSVTLNPGAITQTSATATINFNGLAAGTYTAIVTDANGCQFNLNNMVIVPGAGLIATPSSTATTCPGVNNGSISVTMGSGAAPFTAVMDGTVTQTSATNIISFAGVSPGTHTIIVTDANGCVTSTPVSTTVATGTGYTATFVPTATGCLGVNNGSLSITAQSPGAAPFSAVLSPGGSTQTSTTAIINFSGLGAGTYSAVITDANGCQTTVSNMTVSAGAGLTGTPNPTGTSCPGINNGSVSLTMGTGTAPFTAVLDGTVTQTSATNVISFTGLAAGPHSITVTDANGCVTSTPITTTVPAGTGFTATFVPTPTGCLGVNNGSVSITSQAPGTAPFSAVLNPGAIVQTSATSTVNFAGLAPGTYSAVITDANGCQTTVSNMTIAAGAGLIATPTATPTSCSGINNGSISLNMGSGAPPFTAVMDGTITQTSATNIILFTGVAAGPHSITVTDASGCVTSTPVTTTVAAGTGFTATFTPTATSCAGAANGSLVLVPQPGGTAPFSAVLTPGGANQTGTGTITFNNLIAGTYSATLTDANGCQYTVSNMIVAGGNALNAIPAAVSTSCGGAVNGSINVQAPTNGTAPYLYSLNAGTPQASPSFTGLAAGNYTINVTDAGGCASGSLAITVNPGPQISVTANKSDANCFGSASGSITAAPSANATAPVEYSIDNVSWQASNNFTNLAAGPYTVYIRDAVGCTNSTSVTIGEPQQLQASTSQQAVLCNSGSNGKIVVAATGGTSPYSYSLDNINFQPANTFNVAAGNYTAYVRDARGCSVAPINVTVTEPALLTAAGVSTNATCDGGNDGTITINSVGGVSPYQYSIAGGGYQPGNSFNVGPGTYDVNVQDVNGCIYPVTGIVVGLNDNLTFTPMVDPAPVCESKSVSLQLVTNATQFTWSNAATLTNSAIANPVAQPSVSTLYTVTATLGRCSIVDNVFVEILPAPIPDAGPAGDICFGQTYQLQGTGGNTYLWTPSDNLSSDVVPDPVVTPDKTTTYTLTVVDANGCSSLITDQVVVNVTPPIKVTTYPMDTVVYAGAQIPLLATSAGTDYIWTPAAGLDNPNIPNPLATAPMIDGSVVNYKVTVTTTAGCAGEGFVNVRVYKGPDIYVVTAFSPNGDGSNETFVPFPVGIKKLNYFKVFNRWGQMVFSTTTLNKGWDGRLGGVDQPTGVYVWMVEGITMDNKVISKRGSVVVVR